MRYSKTGSCDVTACRPDFPAGESEKETGKDLSLRTAYQQRGGEQRLHMRFARNAVSDYENRVILENMCPAFLDMYTSRNGADLDVYYRITGYSRLKNCARSRILSGFDILKTVTDLLELVKSCEDYLIFSEYISLRTDHIFVSQEDSSLRLMYLPGYRTTRSLRNLVAALIDDLSAADIQRREDEDLITEYQEKILENEYGIQGYINLAEDLMRRKIRSEWSGELPAKLNNKEESEGEKVREAEGEYFTEKIGSLISVKKKLTELMENLLM